PAPPAPARASSSSRAPPIHPAHPAPRDVSSSRVPARVAPMLATLVDAPFHRPGWVWEEKYDGIRLITRNDKDRTEDFPEVAAALAALPAPTLVLDGEVVVFDAAGISRFQLLQ